MILDIFSKKYNIILHPFYLESLSHLAGFIEEKERHFSFNQLKQATVEIFSFLLENSIVYVLEDCWMENKAFRKTTRSKKEIIDKINQHWQEDTSWDDFYNLAWFRFEEWYREKLVRLGLENKPVNWNEFINVNIGDLEKWISDNKPKAN